MEQKERKTLYLPQWIIQMLDNEGSAFKGPGLVASAAIWDFCSKTDDAKIAIYKKYGAHNVETTYGCAGEVDVSVPVKPVRSRKAAQAVSHQSTKKVLQAANAKAAAADAQAAIEDENGAARDDANSGHTQAKHRRAESG
jgi:hypothetical protein